MQKRLTDLIVKRLNETQENLKQQFLQSHPIKVARHFALDDLLPTTLAEQIYAEFPHPKKMTLLHNYGEIKSRYKHLKFISPLLQAIHFAIQDPKVIAVIEAITGIQNQVSDSLRPAGGISSLLKGYYINPHLDYSHNANKNLYRAVNLLYYVSPNWKIEDGGNFEVWDTAVENRIIIPNFFNRLVVMETNRRSWHSVNPVVSDMPRCCVFNYFFSPQSPEGEDYFHAAPFFSLFNPLFKSRPEQKLQRKLAAASCKLTKLFKTSEL